MLARSWLRLLGQVLLAVLALACPREDDGARRIALAAGAPLELGAAGSGPEVAVVALAAGDFASVLVEQRGVDLGVRLVAPGGEVVLELDNWSGADGAFGPERAVWVAERAGEHRLEIAPVKAGRSGAFTLTLEVVRPATAADRQRAAAERALSAADRLAAGEGARDEALASYHRAAVAFRALGEHHREADALFRLAELCAALGEAGVAELLYGQALALYESVGNLRQIALTLHHRGYLRKDEGELATALADLERALPLWQEVGDRRGEALTETELGALYRYLNEARPALAAYDGAIRLWRELGDPKQEARTLHNRGRLELTLGRLGQARSDLAAALALRRALGDGESVASTLALLGWLEVEAGRGEEARQHFAEVQAVAGARPSQAGAMALAGLGRLDEAAALFRTLGDRAWEAKVLQLQGRAHLAAGHFAEAGQALRAARAAFAVLRDRGGAAATELALAALAREEGDFPAARAAIERAITTAEDLRTQIAESPELRATFFAGHQDAYDALIDLDLALADREPGAGHAAAALTTAERSRARALLELLGGSGTRQDAAGEERDLARRIAAGEARLRRRAASGAASAAELAALEGEQAEALRRFEQLREERRAQHPGRGASRPLTAAEIQARLLDRETALFELRLGTPASHLWVVTQRTLRAYSLPPAAELAGLARSAYAAITADRRQGRARTEAQLAELSRLLLAPAAAALTGKRRIAWVADGALAWLPLAALPLPEELAGPPGAPLISRFEVVTLPSASSLAAIRRNAAARPRAPELLAVVAAPERGGEAPLRHAAAEAGAILALAPAGGQARALAASRALLLSGELARYRILHFATHGEVASDQPELARLVFATPAPGESREGELLHAYEIKELDLPAELVVLAACRTALGAEIRGEGLFGLTQSFFHAGAARVLVSLWDVDDRATLELMSRFYTHLLAHGRAPAAALAAAQAEMAADPQWQAPVDWAGFTLQGEWRDLPRPLNQFPAHGSTAPHPAGSPANTAGGKP